MLFFWASECAGLNQVTSTFWDGAQSFPVGGQAAIPHLKEHVQIFHIMYSGIQVLRNHTGTAIRASKPSEKSSKRSSAPSVLSVEAVIVDESSVAAQIDERVNSKFEVPSICQSLSDRVMWPSGGNPGSGGEK